MIPKHTQETTRNARCPRCGYDLRGTLATWETICPLQGRCAECGLNFDWAELLSPAVSPPKWCLEYGIGMRQFLRRICLTMQYTLWPPKFFSQLKMSHDPNVPRLIGALIMVFVVVYAMFAFGQGMIALSDWMYKPPLPANSYSTNGYEILFKTMLLPFSEEPFGIVRVGIQSWPMNSPFDYSRQWWGMLDLGILFIGFTFACPLVFLALPHSMRKAKVRWIHIQRISAYSIFMLLLTLFFCIMTATMQNMPDSVVITTLRRPLRLLSNSMFLLIVPMQMFWWYSAIARYLRMDDHWKIWLSVVVIALLFSIAVMYYTYPDRIIHLVEVLLYPSRRGWPLPF